MARKRYQQGSLILRGKRRPVWVGRWLEDERDVNGEVKRVYKCEILATVKDCPTRKLALRLLNERLAHVNSISYKPTTSLTFADLAAKWKESVLPQHKASSKSGELAHIDKWLTPVFGGHKLTEITVEMLQRFVTQQTSAPKTVRNIFSTFRLIWHTAEEWGYVPYDSLRLKAVKLPKKRRVAAVPYFSMEESKRIITAAKEPFKTMYWIAAETGIRAGEVVALKKGDIDLVLGVVHVKESAWRGKLQTPKTDNAIRQIAISPQLVLHIVQYVQNCWRPSEENLLFSTKNGTAFDHYNLVSWQLQPLVVELGIRTADTVKGVGFKAFRHGSATIMDRMNAPIRMRTERLGHSDPMMTLGTYTHAVSEDEQRIAAMIGSVLAPEQTGAAA
jgi:integrase